MPNLHYIGAALNSVGHVLLKALFVSEYFTGTSLYRAPADCRYYCIE